jgi:2-methylcitrate dehydratase
MDKTVSALSEFASNLQYEDIRPAALHAAKRSIIDSLGCAIGSFEEDTIATLRRLASRMHSDSPSTIFGTRVTTSPEWAAFVNGSMIRYSDFSDDYFGTEYTTARGDVGPHPSDNLGGVFAAAESTGCDGRAALLGVVIAYEVCGQFTDEVVLRSKGWDYATFHAIATALAAGRLLGLDKDKLANATRLAVVPNMSLYETRVGELSHWKALAGPNGSRNGVFAAQLASEGLTGPSLAFEGRRGFMNQVGAQFKLGKFGGGDQPFRIEYTYFKSMPIRYELQTPVELALILHRAVGADAIESIRVFLNPKSMATREEEPSHWDPMTRETADHSCPYLIGAAIVDGKIGHDTFKEERYRDTTLLAFIDRIEIVPDATLGEIFPWRMATRFEVNFKSGESKTFVHENAKGHPQNPFTDQEIEEKFFEQTANVIPRERGRQIIDLVWSLENAKSLKSLFDLMVVSER